MKKLSLALTALLMMISLACLAEEAADPFVGRWQDPVYGRAVLEIKGDDGGYAIRITWGNSADSDGVWEMEAVREGDSLVYSGGSMAIVTYGEGGDVVDTDVLYDDAEGAFTLTEAGKLLWDDSREDRAPEFAYEKLWPTEGQVLFASLTGLDGLRQKLDGGVTIESAYYTDGYGFSTSEFTTRDALEIESLWEALNQIEVVGPTNESITDWYPQIVFHLSDGSTFGVRFEAHWLQIGGRDNYALANDEDFWVLTAYMVR